jgi:undecaprenyl-diphosphatase
MRDVVKGEESTSDSDVSTITWRERFCQSASRFFPEQPVNPFHFLKELDEAALNWFRNLRSPRLDVFMADVTALGGNDVLTLIVVFTLGLLLALRRYLTAGFVLFSVVGGAILVTALKEFFARPRPDSGIPVIALPQSPSFPSGHSMVSAVVYLTLALLVAGRLQGRRVRAYLIGSSLFLTFLIGVSRIYLGVHYLTDVVAGWFGGMAWALAWRWVENYWLARRERAVAVDEGDGTPVPEGLSEQSS